MAFLENEQEAIVLEGDIAPGTGGGTDQFFYGASINDSSDIVFLGGAWIDDEVSGHFSLILQDGRPGWAFSCVASGGGSRPHIAGRMPSGFQSESDEKKRQSDEGTQREPGNPSVADESFGGFAAVS